MIDVTADEDCTSAVKAKPIMIRRNGFDMAFKASWNHNASLKIFIDVLITSRATNTNPRPPMIIPRVLSFSFLQSISINMPIAARGSKNAAKSKALSAAIWAVIVVPMFAPMIIAVAIVRDITPAFTKPTVMTVVAEED